MAIDFKKLAPWNWFKKEQEEQQSTASLPVPVSYTHLDGYKRQNQLNARGLSSFKLTDLYRLGPSILRLRDDMEIAINALVDRNLIIDYRGGKPASIALNPYSVF